ncbi:hypothetical protein SDC9_166603 [bioreactor metagenome]|uniref:Uncharacterized protein n=1 Tax=bioreactor metagenome TaxID=1076179 RepID=A0A645FXI8_9ZZZZ
MLNRMLHESRFELNDSTSYTQFGIISFINVVTLHVVRQIATKQDKGTRSKTFDTIARETQTRTLFHPDNLILAMKMPRISEVRIIIVTRINRIYFRNGKFFTHDLFLRFHNRGLTNALIFK